MPATPSSSPWVKSGTFWSRDVASKASLPQMVLSSSAASSTFWVIGPIWSSDEAKATRPERDTLP